MDIITLIYIIILIKSGVPQVRNQYYTQIQCSYYGAHISFFLRFPLIYSEKSYSVPLE